MKKIFKLLTVAICLLAFLNACKKNNGGGNPNGNNFSDSIKNIVPQPIIDSLRSWGMKINDGLTPPSVTGIYEETQDSCEFDNSGDNYAGTIFASYKFKFSHQNNNKLTIEMEKKNVNDYSDSSYDSSATFIAGNGKYFTIFAQETGLEKGINYTALSICSGEVTGSGIINLQYAIYLKSKVNDPNNTVLMSVGSSRIFTNADGPAIPATDFSMNPNLNTQSPAPLLLMRTTAVPHQSAQ